MRFRDRRKHTKGVVQRARRLAIAGSAECEEENEKLRQVVGQAKTLLVRVENYLRVYDDPRDGQHMLTVPAHLLRSAINDLESKDGYD